MQITIEKTRDMEYNYLSRVDEYVKALRRAKMEKILRTILKVLSTALIAVVVILAILLAGIRVIGLTPYTVLSGSMEPAYHVGSIIYVKDVEPTELKVRDPLTFRMSGGTIVTHRIIEILNEGTAELSFRTQGDANEAPDGVIPAAAIIGKPVFSIPYLGYFSAFLQRPQGLICVVGCTGMVMALSFLVDALFSKPEKSESQSDEEENIG